MSDEIIIRESSPLVIEVVDDDGELVARTPVPGVSGVDRDWSLAVYEERPSRDEGEYCFGMKEVPREDDDSEYRLVISF